MTGSEMFFYVLLVGFFISVPVVIVYHYLRGFWREEKFKQQSSEFLEQYRQEHPDTPAEPPLEQALISRDEARRRRAQELE